MNDSLDFGAKSRTAVEATIVQLLSEKHLYQVLRVDFSELDNCLPKLIQRQSQSVPHTPGQRFPTTTELQQLLNGYKIARWCPKMPEKDLPTFLAAGRPVTSETIIDFELKTICTWCEQCEKKHPFGAIFGWHRDGSPSNHQSYTLGYRCQACSQYEVHYLIRRDGEKLLLCGRAPMEKIDLPKFLPKKQASHLSNAIVAHNAGQTLAAIFLMRVFIEQYLREHPKLESAVKAEKRISGDKLGQLYSATLPTDFSSRFPSLGNLYDKLSDAIHSARADDALFEEVSMNIIDHFDAKRLYRIE